jgi:DNA-3-methyladenine glycosylase II
MDFTILKHLSQDPVLKKLIEAIDIPKLSSKGDLYEDLIRSIVSQQLSIKAASTIYVRFLDLFTDGYAYPEEVMALDLPGLRSVGLSRQKASYIQNVADFFVREKLEQKDWSVLNDEEIIEYLTQIKGVGTWTVQMILMFTLERPDVFPVGDLGIRNSMIRLYGVEENGKQLKPKLVELAEQWRPYRTFACRYLWQWKDGGA